MIRGRKKILMLGAGGWQVASLRIAKNMGLEIISVDPHRDAPGFSFCDHAYHCNLLDRAAVLDIAKKHQVDGIFTGVDLAVPTMASVACDLSLPAITPLAARLCTNKVEMRRKARELNLKVPKYFAVRSKEEALSAALSLGYPCIVKPSDNCGSRGVTVVDDQEDLDRAFQNAMMKSFSREVLVEEFMMGTEASVEGFVENGGKFRILGISDKQKSPLPSRFDLELHYPGDFSKNTLDELTDYTTQLIEGFGIHMGLTHTELMVSPDGIRLVETAARGCGGGVVGRLLPAITGVDFLGFAIRQSMGECVELPAFHATHGLLKFFVAAPGVVTMVAGTELAAATRGVIEFAIDVKPGDQIVPATDTSGRVGHLIIHGSDRDEVDRISEEALGFLQIETRQATLGESR